MESFTITFTGKQSTLESVFFPSIDLQGEYQIGLVDFQSYNSIYNVNQPNNVFYYYEPIEFTDTPKGTMSIKDFIEKFKKTKLKDKIKIELEEGRLNILSSDLYIIRTMGFVKSILSGRWSSHTDKITVNENENIWYCDLKARRTITIPEGNYEIEEIEKEVRKTVPSFELIGNNVTMSCLLKSSVLFDFNRGGMGVDMLGFTEYAEPHVYYHARNKININNVNVIRIKCNIAAGSFMNGKPDHTIHSFFPLVPPGYKMVEVPKNIIYFPINVRTLDTVTITIVDQNDRPIDFHDEEITMRCHIRKLF